MLLRSEMTMNWAFLVADVLPTLLGRHDTEKDTFTEGVQTVDKLQLCISSHSDHLIHLLESEGDGTETFHETFQAQAAQVVTSLLGRISLFNSSLKIGGSSRVLFHSPSVLSKDTKIDVDVLGLFFQSRNLALECPLIHISKLIGGLVIPVTKSLLVFGQSLLILLKLVPHLDLHCSCLVQFVCLLIEFSLEGLELLLLGGQSFFSLRNLCLKLFGSLALIVNVIFELLKVARGGRKFLGRLGMVLFELDFLLLRLDLADLSVGDFLVVGGNLFFDGINLGSLCTELLTTNFHDFVLQSLDLFLNAGCLSAEPLNVSVEFGDFLLQSGNAAVVCRRRLVLPADFLDAPLHVGDVPLSALDLEADLLHLGIELGNLLVQFLEASFTLSLVLLEFLELCLPAISLGRHETSLDSCTTTGHGTGLVNQLTGKGNDSPSLGTIRNPVRLSKVCGDKGILHGVVEGRSELVLLGSDEIEQSRSVLRSLDWRKIKPSQLVQADKVTSSNVVLSEVLDTLLTSFDRLGDKVVESTASCRDGHVSDGTSIGLFLEDVELTLSNCGSRLLLVDLLVPGLKRLLQCRNLIRKFLCLAFKAVSDLDKLSLSSLNLLLKLGDFLSPRLDLFSTLLNGFCQLVFVPDKSNCLILFVLEAVLLLLNVLNTAALFHAHIVEGFDLGGGLFDRSLVLGCSNNIFKVFEQTIFVLVAGLGLHLSDGLDFTLKNQETLVVQINAPIAEESCDCREVGFFSVDVVFARVVLESPS
ncbi:hypothetical protein HG531_010844 [Fusarium graminearum]|nr:hypothetical protein HG531_010844 [Fusarium graminearum]